MGVCPTSPLVLCGSVEIWRPRDILWGELRTIQSLYSPHQSRVSISRSDSFPVAAEFCQGCLFVTGSVHCFYRQTFWVQSNSRGCYVRWTLSLLFADDALLLALLENDFSSHWNRLQPSVSGLVWKSGLLNLRPWFSAQKKWNAHYRLSRSPSLK